MAPFEYYRATSLADALGQMSAQTGAVPLAGGTNLVDMMKAGASSPTLLVDLGGVAGYRDVSLSDDGWVSIGALATNADVADHPELLLRYPLVAEALLAGASPQLRNAASIGGNLMQSNRCCYF